MASSFPEDPYRKSLSVVVAVLLKEYGFSDADYIAIETLVEMLESYISELGRSSRGYAEHSGRCQVVPSDVTLALINMAGLAVSNQMTKSLSVGKPKTKPPYIPDHLPSFPDPHTYIHTECQVHSNVDYKTARESVVLHQRGIQVSLVSLMAKHRQTHNLTISGKSYTALLPKSQDLPYLEALLPFPDSAEQAYEASESQQDEGIAGRGSTESRESSGRKEAGFSDNPYNRPTKLPRSGR